MTKYFDVKGSALALKEELGRGGEGAVFALSDPKLCAKIYHAPLQDDRAQKIQAMAGVGTETLAKLTSWPVDLVLDDRRRPMGLVIPRVPGGKDIHRLYSPRSRRTDFLRADWRFLVRVAANTAKSFAAVHDAGVVIGDVNHGSILVGQDATVRLIDCDSFQVEVAGTRYLCEVGVETYTPPELQGKSFRGILRTANHDAFGLAVLVFHLLMMGRHPFSGRFLGAGDMPIPTAIEQVRFAYGARRSDVQMDRPPGAPGLETVGALGDLFERAFSRAGTGGGRPTAKEWAAGLSALENNLRQCRANDAHWHLSNLSDCPWCRLEGATGVTLFPLVVQAGQGTAHFDVDALVRQLSAIGHPGPAPALDVAEPAPDPTARALKNYGLKRNGAAVAVAAAAFVCLMGAGLAFFAFVAAAGGFFAVRAVMDRDADLAQVRNTLTEKEQDWAKADAAWERSAGSGAFDTKRAEVFRLLEEWKGLPQVRLQRLAQLQADQRRLQMNRYLDGHSIEKAMIPGIGAGRKSALASEGVETAADVTLTSVRVPGFGPSLQGKLLDWRTELERRFVFDPKRPVDQRDIARVEQEVLAERKRLESAMQTGVAAVQQTRAQIMAARANMRPQVEHTRLAYLQAQADRRIAG